MKVTSSSAKSRGEVRKRRRKLAERRKATEPVRKAYNKMMHAQDHPGWRGMRESD